VLAMSILTITTHYLYNKIVYITELKKNISQILKSLVWC